jgi:TonB family protein
MLTFKDVVFPPSGGKEKKISLNLSKFVPPPAPKPVVIPPKPKPLPVIPPTPQPVKKEPVKEVITPALVAKKKLLDDKKRLVVERKESEENNVTKAVPKKEKKLVKKEVKKKPKKIVKKEIKKRVVKRTKPKKRRRSKDPLANALMGSSGTSMYPTNRRASSGSYAAKMIKQLYGNEFNSFSPTQKKFIQNNLGTIHRITQRTLIRNGYPRVAVQTRQQGTNVVSFYLHPNGDITELRLKRPMGYEALDQNTLDVIRIAYKNYPLPNKKTKIMFYVTYTLY